MLKIYSVAVVIKGTQNGVITDIDGNFSVDINGEDTVLEFRYLGFENKEIAVQPNSFIEVVLSESLHLLQETVVIGYGVQKRMSLTGSVSTVSSSEERAPLENLEEETESSKEQEVAENKLYQELLQLNGLRSNFSDVGFWEPALRTNRKGEAKFSVTFPDNITQWDAIVYAMNSKLQTGTLRKSIKSYKPLMAELKTPQFLVIGDQSYFAGNIRNYTSDKHIDGKIMFAIEQDTVMNKAIDFTSSYQDKLLVKAYNTDSISATYLFTRNDGYNDGELRTIPIVPQGVEIAKGTLVFLKNGDKMSFSADNNEDVHLSITGKQLDVYMDATSYLTGYKYACNEQLASKLIGLLNYKQYKKYIGEEFKNDKNINEIINRLVKNRNNNKLWSWWGSSNNTSFWMSAHIMRALKMAKNADYNVNIDLGKTTQDYTDVKNYRRFSLHDIDVIHALSEWNSEQNYKGAIDIFDKLIKEGEQKEDSIKKVYEKKKWSYTPYSFLKEKLLLQEIRQKHNIEYCSDSVSKYLKKDILGAVYCTDGNRSRYWYNNDLATTIIAYRIIKKDSTLVHYKEPIQMYILGTKSYGWNSYQASSATSTILPDLLSESVSKDKPATVMLSGKDNRKITQFPFKTTLTNGESLSVDKLDGMPLIYSAHTIKRVTKANATDAFEVETYLTSGDTLIAGKQTTLTVKLKVKQKNTEHAMIEVPIPAGCSYASNGTPWGETHREYFKEKTVIFCERIDEGEYTFYIDLLPRYSGRYILNPAKVELMYFPVINANNDLRNISIRD